MYVAKAYDVDIFDRDGSSGGFHYYLVSRYRGRIVAHRMTHWVDPVSKALVKGGKGFLHRFSGTSNLSVLLKHEPRTKDVRGRPLGSVEDSVFEKVGDVSSYQESVIRKQLGKPIR